VEGAIEAERGSTFAGKIARASDDRSSWRAHEGVAMSLTARQRARVAAQEGKVGREILTKRHVRYDSYSQLRVL
jgi:hypothetical protein